ncbi:MAG: T9SS type A sorting domain-containing protein [candidate division Zixibacteria bacterium]|nr:T9SS type A sorting domain-containing protein [candidate division Zixibacteria bacterium]
MKALIILTIIFFLTIPVYAEDLVYPTDVNVDSYANISPSSYSYGDTISISFEITNNTSWSIDNFFISIFMPKTMSLADENIRINGSEPAQYTIGADPFDNTYAANSAHRWILDFPGATENPIPANGTLELTADFIAGGSGNFANTPYHFSAFMSQADVSIFGYQGEGQSGFTISGNVFYYSDNSPACPSVTVRLSGGVSRTTTTSSTGNYRFQYLPGNNSYTITPLTMDYGQGTVGSYDAALILQKNIGNIEFSPFQLLAGDVNENWMVATVDASLIMQYLVGMIDSLPAGIARFTPDSYEITEDNYLDAPENITISNLQGDDSGNDFIAVVYGDVDTSYIPALIVEPNNQNPADEYDYDYIEFQKVIEFDVEIPDDAPQEFYSFFFRIEYNEDNFSQSSFIINPEFEDILFFENSEDNNIRVTAAGIDLQQPSGSLGKLRLVINDDYDWSSPLEVELAYLEIDRYRYLNRNTWIIDAGEQVPSEFSIMGNYPNPFNSSTTIKIRTPESGELEVSIYNLAGQRVNTINLITKGSGEHDILWDGFDWSGRGVAGGVYFYKAIFKNSIATGKMTILK